jgi:Holliday junction resolvase RusA-like endonuclease
MIKITDVIEMPWLENLSVNHCRMGPGGNWNLKPDVKGWMDRLAWEVKPLNILNYGLPLTIIVDLRFPDARRRDDHNYYKVICDAVAMGLGIDDKDIRIRTGTVVVDRGNAGFTITLTDEEEG